MAIIITTCFPMIFLMNQKAVGTEFQTLVKSSNGTTSRRYREKTLPQTQMMRSLWQLNSSTPKSVCVFWGKQKRPCQATATTTRRAFMDFEVFHVVCSFPVCLCFFCFFSDFLQFVEVLETLKNYPSGCFFRKKKKGPARQPRQGDINRLMNEP